MQKREARMESRWKRGIRMGLYAGAVGFGAGMIITAVAGAIGGQFLLWLPLFFAAVTGVSGYLIGALVIEGTADVAARIYGGGHVGTQREYSHAQSLAARGDYRGAIAAYEAAAEEFPDDPYPLLLGARVLRDELDDPEAAAEWLRRARTDRTLDRSMDMTVSRELVELYEGPLDAPTKALPELARLAETYPGTRSAEWATALMERLRASTRPDAEDETGPTVERSDEAGSEPDPGGAAAPDPEPARDEQSDGPGPGTPKDRGQ